MDPSSSRRPQQGTGRKPPISRPPVSKPSGKLRGHPRDADEVRISKTLSWILRHGAKSEGLNMRQDGFVKVVDLLALPKMNSMDFMKLEELVKADAKQRYHLVSEPPSEGESGSDVWWIRANQGHSLKDVDLQHAELTDAQQVPMAVHGTTAKAWELIATQGLSKMTRQHIHLAQGVAGDGAISGMRKSSQILIYVDIESALRAGLKFYLSQNGVVLTPGDERGMLGPEFFSKVEKANGTPVPGWIRPELKEMRTNADVLCGDNSSTAQTGNTLQTDGVLHS